MTAIKPGTACFLTGLAEMDHLSGRVVEVLSGPMLLPDESGEWYQVTAEWAREMFPGREMQSARCNLLPLLPPELAPPEARKCAPVSAC